MALLARIMRGTDKTPMYVFVLQLISGLTFIGMFFLLDVRHRHPVLAVVYGLTIATYIVTVTAEIVYKVRRRGGGRGA
jgi:tryptophan-rich sensory protein